MKYREALYYGESELKRNGIEDAKTDAWLLLQMACKIDRNYYYLNMEEDVPEDKLREYQGVIDKRLEHVPLQYITGEQEFMGLSFLVNSEVLIPRQDTETLVEEALKLLAAGMKVIDMCTGTGCVLISILKNQPFAEGVGYDISKLAVKTAKENARRLEVPALFEKSDLFASVTEKADLIVANPPYIKTSEIAHLMPEISQYEPVTALDGHEDGLYYYRRITEECLPFLEEEGYLLLEIGCDQGKDVTSLMEKAGFSNIRIVKDLAGKDRVVTGQMLRKR